MRQHYIPQWLLRNFLDSNGKIYGFVTSNPDGGVFATAPKKLMVEKDLYTLRGESWPDEQAAEKEFSRREDLMKPVADKIILAARNNALPRLTLRERLFCLYFHHGTWARTRYIAAASRRLRARRPPRRPPGRRPDTRCEATGRPLPSFPLSGPSSPSTAR